MRKKQRKLAEAEQLFRRYLEIRAKTSEAADFDLLNKLDELADTIKGA